MERGVRADSRKFNIHIFLYFDVFKPKKHRFFYDLPCNITFKDICAVQDQQHINVISGHHIGSFFDAFPGRDVNYRGRHHIHGSFFWIYTAPQKGLQRPFYLNQGPILYGGGCCLWMPPSTEGKCYLGHIYILYPATCHKVDPALHLGQGENKIQILHFHEFVYKDGKISHIFVSNNLCKNYLHTIDNPFCGRLSEIIK